MLKIKQEGPVSAYEMGRSIGFYVPYTVHAYLIGETLVDTGTRYAGKEFEAALGTRLISTVINTHHHEDHIGNNYLIQNKYGAKIYADEQAISLIQNPKLIDLRPYRKFVWSRPMPSRAEAIGESIEVGSYVFRVIKTGGHAPDHICLYEPSRGWLFSGDMFCGYGLKYMRKDEEFSLILESLKCLANLDVDIVFCGLLGIVQRGREALKRKIAFMEGLQEKALEANRQGRSIRAITRQLLGREGAMSLLTAGHFSKKNVIESILRTRQI